MYTYICIHIYVYIIYIYLYVNVCSKFVILFIIDMGFPLIKLLIRVLLDTFIL